LCFHAPPEEFVFVKVKPTGLDSLGQLLSLLCIVHCALLPWLLASLPAITPFMENGHPVLFALVLATCLLALLPGSRQHRRWNAWPWALVGMGLLAGAMLFLHNSPPREALSSSAGALCMLVAHHKNRQHLKNCSCCRNAHKKAL
jgi:peptidoglycan/LPS O-acetylase OafA/YrhL